MDSPVFRLPRFNCVNVTYKEKNYQLRIEQLTTKNISKIFNLIPDTVVLVSADGAVSLPDDHGKFADVDEVTDHEWAVQGAESSKRVGAGAQSAGTSSGNASKWKPSGFLGRSTNGASSSGHSSKTSEVSSLRVLSYYSQINRT